MQINGEGLLPKARVANMADSRLIGSIADSRLIQFTHNPFGSALIELYLLPFSVLSAETNVRRVKSPDQSHSTAADHFR